MSSAPNINGSGSAEMGGGGDAFGFAPTLGLRDETLANAAFSPSEDYDKLRWEALKERLLESTALPGTKTPPFFFDVASTARAA